MRAPETSHHHAEREDDDAANRGKGKKGKKKGSGGFGFEEDDDKGNVVLVVSMLRYGPRSYLRVATCDEWIGIYSFSVKMPLAHAKHVLDYLFLILWLRFIIMFLS